MKVLVINGSPKGEKSNTLRLTRAFLDGTGAQEQEIETLHIHALKIEPCRGCFACWNKTPGKCVIQDDMAMVLERILQADVIVWSFPLYYFSVPGSLKTLMDRQLPLALPFMEENKDGTGSGSHPARYDMSGKRYVVISTCGFYSAEKNYDAVLKMFDHMCGKDNYTAIFCGQGELFRVPQLRTRTDAYLETVKQSGAEFMGGAVTQPTKEKLKELLYPKDVFERMADASWGIQRNQGSAGTVATDETLTFTQQMAALYQKESYDGKDRILEMHYTDRDKTYQIAMEKDGYQVITNEKDFRPSTTRIETPFTVWLDISEGKITGEAALMEGKYRVQGDFSLMIHWDNYFGYAAPAQPKAVPSGTKVKKTNMLLLLLPWTITWSLLSVDAKWGSVAGIAVCALIPLLWQKFKNTVYESLTILCVTGVSLGVLLGAPVTLMLPLSYLLFGLMWFVSVFVKIPLTANYSMNDYNGERALQNPLFIRTNRILTACWGVLYLITPIWTYFLLGTQAASLIGAINSVLPLLLGIFTAWFQKWYPAKVARG